MIFCDRVLECLSRATRKEKEAVRAELEAHMEDHRDALIERGMDPMAAMNKAEEAMGDPEKVGKALNAQFSTFWLWAKRGIQVTICLVLIVVVKFYPYSEKAWTGTWEVLAGARDNAQARKGEDLFLPTSGVGHNMATHAWSCWETMRVGDEMVCLYWVELHPVPDELEMPGYYYGDIFFCTYNVNLFAPANGELLERLTVVSENGMESSEYLLEWRSPTLGSRGVQERFTDVLVKEGDTYVDVTYDYFGLTAAMRCPLLWTEVEP
ncbi:MAG: hypothetical protein J6C43_00725 [Oscillospiraceae bacterium]|nr:hypothetical protein [Oscillospiraceae bacterium]